MNADVGVKMCTCASLLSLSLSLPLSLSLVHALISVDNLLTHSLKVDAFVPSSVSPFKPACLFDFT